MSAEPYLEPLGAADALLRLIVGAHSHGSVEVELAQGIDSFVYSLRFLLVDDVRCTPETEAEPPDCDYRQLYDSIGRRFPKIGLYWVALDSRMSTARLGKVSVGDAIDDLADIAKELLEVDWYKQYHGRQEALAALRWRYENHLRMHIPPLRAHLEELIYLGQENDQDQSR